MTNEDEREFAFEGNLKLRGVWFFIKAKNAEEAKEKAARGQCQPSPA